MGEAWFNKVVTASAPTKTNSFAHEENKYVKEEQEKEECQRKYLDGKILFFNKKHSLWFMFTYILFIETDDLHEI